MKLSILICTLPERKKSLENLLNVLSTQTTTDVEILTDNSSRKVTTGEKRNRLLNRSTGKYVVFIDDDDMIPEYYLKEILKGIEIKPDSIGFEGYVTKNGKFDRKFLVGISWDEWRDDEYYYYRNTNHICPVKREIAIKAGFPNKTIGEDYEYSKRIQPYLKTEYFIHKEMYYYHVQSK